MDPEVLKKHIQHYEDGLITGYELVQRLDEWRKTQNMEALHKEHHAIFNPDPGAAIEKAVFGG